MLVSRKNLDKGVEPASLGSYGRGSACLFICSLFALGCITPSDSQPQPGSVTAPTDEFVPRSQATPSTAPAANDRPLPLSMREYSQPFLLDSAVEPRADGELADVNRKWPEFEQGGLPSLPNNNAVEWRPGRISFAASTISR